MTQWVLCSASTRLVACYWIDVVFPVTPDNGTTSFVLMLYMLYSMSYMYIRTYVCLYSTYVVYSFCWFTCSLFQIWKMKQPSLCTFAMVRMTVCVRMWECTHHVYWRVCILANIIVASLVLFSWRHQSVPHFAKGLAPAARFISFRHYGMKKACHFKHEHCPTGPSQPLTHLHTNTHTHTYICTHGHTHICTHSNMHLPAVHLTHHIVTVLWWVCVYILITSMYLN